MSDAAPHRGSTAHHSGALRPHSGRCRRSHATHYALAAAVAATLARPRSSERVETTTPAVNDRDASSVLRGCALVIAGRSPPTPLSRVALPSPASARYAHGSPTRAYVVGHLSGLLVSSLVSEREIPGTYTPPSTTGRAKQPSIGGPITSRPDSYTQRICRRRPGPRRRRSLRLIPGRAASGARIRSG